MVEDSGEVGGASCCRFRMPSIPTKWLLFIDFAFTLGTSVVYLADIVTDAVTLKAYWDRDWYYSFGFSLGFIVVPSILLAVLECQFLIKTYGKNTKWSTVLIRTLLNIPFQLTVIWYHFKLSYRYLKVWLDHLNKKDRPITAEDRKVSMSNLADLDDRANTIERHAISSKEVPAADIAVAPAAYDGGTDHTWWKQLTREEWLSHLNKMKLTESMLESLPQLLINLYLIVKYTNTPWIQYLSATLSYLSLCGGIVRFDKTRKDNEAERLMVDRTLLHSRAFVTRLEWPQMLFLSLYKGCFLAARILVFVYFTVYFQVYVLIFIFIHWAVFMGYLLYLWYPSDMHKKTRQLVQADYKFRAYMFLSQDFLSVFHNSLVGIFISVRPRNYAFLGQPYCYLFWYYFVYVIENIVLFMLPGVYFSIRGEEVRLVEYQYYIVMIFELVLNIFGAVLCGLYYFSVHKMNTYTRNAYPQFAKLQSTGICCCCDLSPPAPKEWTVCKQAETSEIFYLRREKLKEYKSGYTTVVRVDRKRGRNLECFIDERGKIFYAPRHKVFKYLPSVEEEEIVNLRKEASRQSLDNLSRETPSSRRPESRSTVRNERLVGEDPSFVTDHAELKPLLSALPPPPPLPSTPPRASTPVEKGSTNGSTRSKQSSRSTTKSKTPSAIPNYLTKDATTSQTARSSTRSTKSQQSNKESAKDQEEPSLHHSGSQQGSSRTPRPSSARSSGKSQRKNQEERSSSPRQSQRSNPPSKSPTSPKQEKGSDKAQGSSSPISPASKRSAHSAKSTSSGRHRGDKDKTPKSEPRSFSPENMWKPRKENDPVSPHDSVKQKSPKIKENQGDGESSPHNSSRKSHRSPEIGDRHESKSHERGSHSHRPESSKNKHQGSSRHSSSGRSSHKISHRHGTDNDDPENSKDRGEPVGNTWI